MVTIRNSYTAEMAVATIEGLAALGCIGFIFSSFTGSIVCLAVFLAAMPAKNYIKYGIFYPSKTHIASAPVPTSGNLQPLARSGSSETVETI